MVRTSKQIPICQIQKLEISWVTKFAQLGSNFAVNSLTTNSQIYKANQKLTLDNHTLIVKCFKFVKQQNCQTPNYQRALVKCVSLSESSESEDTETTMRGGGGARPRSSNSMLVRFWFFNFRFLLNPFIGQYFCNFQWHFWAEASLRYLIYIWNFSLKIQFIFPF